MLDTILDSDSYPEFSNCYHHLERGQPNDPVQRLPVSFTMHQELLSVRCNRMVRPTLTLFCTLNGERAIARPALQIFYNSFKLTGVVTTYIKNRLINS
ncbi:hypothetical protein [Fischerella sp. PCC 9605]|uniref:hypothetical protein n=1 Tax=Fischerella sp. PCC 9605 TaxID=1173024 RepID=UPI003FA48E2B